MTNVLSSAAQFGSAHIVQPLLSALEYCSDIVAPPGPSPKAGDNDDNATLWEPVFGDPIAWKVLSVRQPFAWLLAIGEKDVENRTWDTAYRGPILIHAGKSYHEGYKDIRHLLEDDGFALPDKMERGGIVGVATITDMITRRRHRRDYWFEGPYGWVLEHAYPLPFTPLKGQLNLFTVRYPALLNYPPNQDQT